MIKNNNFKLAENAVLHIEDSLSKVFQNRSKQVYHKLDNILTIFKEEKVSTIHFNQSSGSDMMIYLEKKLMRFLQDCFLPKRQL